MSLTCERVACLWIPSWSLQALLRARPELRAQKVVVSDGLLPSSLVLGATLPLRQLGVRVGQTVAQAQQNLTVYGFTKVTQVDVDSPRPAGTVLSTNPATGQSVPLDTIVELRVSRGNQFTMPDLTGQFWDDAFPNLRALGWTGSLIKGADVPNSGQRSAAVVTQSPAAGSGVNFDAPITLAFAQ